MTEKSENGCMAGARLQVATARVIHGRLRLMVGDEVARRMADDMALEVLRGVRESGIDISIGHIEGPQPIATLELRSGLRFIGLVREVDILGRPFWETVELLHCTEWTRGRMLILNCNSGNYTTLLEHLTHWMPEPPL